MSAPEWVRTATRPTSGEIDRLISPLPPALAAFAREATAPRESEIASLCAGRRTERSTGAAGPLAAAGLLVAVCAGVVLWVGTAPSGIHQTGVARIEAPGIYVVSPDADLVLSGGVRVRGVGQVSRQGDGRLVLSGDLVVAIESETAFEVAGARFAADRAEIVLEPAGLAVIRGSVRSPEGTISAGQRWPDASAPSGAAVAPPRTPIVEPTAPEDVPAPAPPPEIPVALAPPPAPPGMSREDQDWLGVLAVLEPGGSRAERLAAVEAFREAHPASPYLAEAEALSLLLRGTDRPPAEALGEIEVWLGRHPDGARAVELHALAARLARDGLRDCARAEPHDAVVAQTSADPAAAASARALLGLCAAAAGRTATAESWLSGLDPSLLPAELREAVLRASSGRE